MHYPKPVNFLPAEKVTTARFSSSPPPFLNRPARRGKKRQGILYENRVHDHFERAYDVGYWRSPWVIFDDRHRHNRWCQPDAIHIDARTGRITIFEVKYQHCAQAWFQLFHLYSPVIEFLFPKPAWSVGCVEVVKWYDPHTATPAMPILRENPLDTVGDAFCVHIWKPNSIQLPD